MDIFRREKIFCTLCNKSISYRQKPKHRWNIEGYLCGDCYVDEMKKQYEIEEEIKRKNYEKNSEALPKPQKIKPQKSARHIKFSYYFDIFAFIWSPIVIIHGLIDEDPIRWMPAIIILVVVLIQFPKDKKLFNGLSKNEDVILPKTEDTPLTALKMRLAKGEITKEEFDKIKEDLKD